MDSSTTATVQHVNEKASDKLLTEPAEGVMLTGAQKTELEGLKLKDLKAKNYLFQAILIAQSWKPFFARTPPSIFGIP
ncbi:hypothetical protein JRO89_XS12G0210000 [Xanthoceras sorbifolium]|uniref:Uncharacterized protein n=1 Tax=Xanthoceras sorbifolium TaxID=99658 RepID=A0ABQ8HD72_9ROSI|nr:hypothetical protein JRO89_XS12G0210000 [Xanthoceras sorbifolium]